MKNFNFSIFSLLLSVVVLLVSCDGTNEITKYNATDESRMVDSRSGGNCDDCINSLPPKCCCIVELDQLASIDLYICGVSTVGYYNNDDCTMDTGDGCYDVSSIYGIHRTITTGTPFIYFCIVKGQPFSLYNANGSGHGYIQLDCSGTGDPAGGQLPIDLDYGNGSYVRYFQSDSDCDLEPCDF